MPQKIVSWGVSLGYFCCTFSCCLFFPTVVLSGLYFVFIKKNALFSSGQVNDAFTSSRNTSVPILPYHHHFWHMTWYALDIKPILSFAIFFSHHQPATEKSKSYNLQSKTMLKTNEKWLIQPLSVLFLLYFFLFYFFFNFQHLIAWFFALLPSLLTFLVPFFDPTQVSTSLHLTHAQCCPHRRRCN